MSNLAAGFRRYLFSPLTPGVVLQFVPLRATARAATGHAPIAGTVSHHE